MPSFDFLTKKLFRTLESWVAAELRLDVSQETGGVSFTRRRESASVCVCE